MYLIEILHQTTTNHSRLLELPSCILSKFYIKPQPSPPQPWPLLVVSYRNSTSNHNASMPSASGPSVVSYRNSTSNHNTATKRPAPADVVSYRNSTSNHNTPTSPLSTSPLYLIEILHQTTTRPAAIGSISSCILSKFYIKPQRYLSPVVVLVVVSYRNSTSNHNLHGRPHYHGIVVSYRNSTSNHNVICLRWSYWWLYLIEILHQTTTLTYGEESLPQLYLIEILHQTTTSVCCCGSRSCCILSKFYIKPQRLIQN